MAYTTEAAVAAVLADFYDDNSTLTPYIEGANLLVVKVCVPEGYDTAQLEMIERWLAAHLYACRVGQLAAKAIGPARDVYNTKIGLSLTSTTYGQQALLFDTEGALAALAAQNASGGPVQAGIHFLGRVYNQPGEVLE